MKPAIGRILLWALLAIALVPATLVGAFIFLVIDKHHRDADDRTAAAADPRLRRPLVSTSGRILFIAESDLTDDFHVVNIDGSGLRRLTRLPNGWTLSSPPVVSPNRTRLAINVRGVSIVRLDRPGETMQLDQPGGSLAWSPDGKQLASLSIDDQKRLHLNVFDADGGGKGRDIAATWPSTAAGYQQSVGDLAWSPDGKRFAFLLGTSRRPRSLSGPSHIHLYIAPSDGSGLKNLSLEPNPLPLLGNLAWAPDGRRLAGGSKSGIAVVDVDLRWKQIPILTHSTQPSQRPAWSPDGQRLAWFNPDSIVTSDPDGGGQQELTRGRCRGVHPSWSDDGRRIAFACYEGRGTVFVMNADGSGLTSVHVGTETTLFGAEYRPRYPVWLPAISPGDE